jgi:tetratricopeptide (TPR) repeat protein
MPKATKPADPFAQTVAAALDLFSDPQQLGERSPLSAPYFLGVALSGYPDTPAGRGEALRRLLLDSSAELSGEHRHLLNVSVFQRERHLNNTGVVQKLGMSEATYYRHRLSAIAALAEAINRRVTPPLRGEQPLPRALFGRQTLLTRAITALSDLRTVAIAGADGLGKTALASHVAASWPSGRVLWYTVRPGLTDQTDSLLFALAHFLRGLGESSLWRQLVAGRGRIEPAHALGLLRHDLQRLTEPVLICIDDTDWLRLEREPGPGIAQLCEELRPLAALLLIGTHPLIESDERVTLNRLSLRTTQAWIAAAALVPETHLTRASTRLQAAARGNPALIQLTLTLMRDGLSIDQAIDALETSDAPDVLLRRVYQRLDPALRTLLDALSVFDGPVPLVDWRAQMAQIDALHMRGLLDTVWHAGGHPASAVVLPGTIRRFVTRALSVEDAQMHHLNAAAVRERHAEHAAAAGHYLAAGEPALAVWTWHAHRTLEVERGHARMAAQLLAEISPASLTHADDRRALALCRAELSAALGLPDAVDDHLRQVTWPDTHAASSLAAELRASAQLHRGNAMQALSEYRRALSIGGPAQSARPARLQTALGYVYLYQLRDLVQAADHAGLALNQAEALAGLLCEERGDFADAERHYLAAMHAAAGIARRAEAEVHVHAHLGHLYMRMNQPERAITHLTQAMAHADRVGQPVNGLYDRLNLTSALISNGDHVSALAQAGPALALAEELDHGFLVAGLSAARAEAHLGLDDLAQAEHDALRALSREEEAHRPFALAVLGQVQARRGQMGEAERTLQQAIDAARASQDRYAEAEAWQAFARILTEPRKTDAERQAETIRRALLPSMV